MIFSKWFPLLILGSFLGIMQQGLKIAINDILGSTLDYITINNGIKPVTGMIIIIGLGLLNGVLGYNAVYIMGKVSYFGIYKFVVATIKKVKRLPLAYIERHASGDLISRMLNDLAEVCIFFGQQMLVLMMDVITCFVLIAYFLWKDLILGAIVVGCIIILVPVLDRAIKGHREIHKDAMSKKGNSTSKLNDVLQGIREVKAFNAKDIIKKEYADITADERDIAITAMKKENSGFLFGRYVGFIPPFVVYGVGGWLLLNDMITLGTIYAIILTIKYLTDSLYTVVQSATLWKKVSAAGDRLFELIDEKSEDEVWDEQKVSVEKIDVNYVYSFRDVCFAYSTNQEKDDIKHISQNKLVLKNINFDISKGESVAFVGRSGSGKSTLLKLMAGFYPIKNGNIFKYGNNIAGQSLKQIRDDLAMVSQDAFLFPTTIQNNITYGMGIGNEKRNRENNITMDEKIVNAAKDANIHEFIEGQPNKYQSIVGERGIRLSGGQRQRITIARAMIKDADILLLDEPTSALDTESENKIQKAIDQLRKNKTSIIVAHRLSSIKNVDRIYVLDYGQIIEIGSHNELIDKQGLYYELYNKQLDENNREGA